MADSTGLCHPGAPGCGTHQTDTEETPFIMNATASRSSLPLASIAAALLMSVSVSAQAQSAPAGQLQPASAPLGIYGGATAGFGINNWECDVTCDRAVWSGKLFAGKRLTPGLAAEINYFMFGKRTRSNSAATASAMGFDSEDRSVRATAVNILWEVELIQDFTNQLRFGWATVEQTNDRVSGANKLRSKEHYTAPYIGAGLAYRLSRDFKLVSSADFLLRGRRGEYLLSVGGMAEF